MKRDTFRPGDLIKVRQTPSHAADVWFDIEVYDRHVRMHWGVTTVIARCPCIATVIAIHPLQNVGSTTYALYVMLQDGTLGWTWGYSWKKVKT